MKTGSLRARVILATLVLLAVVLAAVVAAVTLAYRARLDGDLRSRLVSAGALIEQSGSAVQAKLLLATLAREGIAADMSRLGHGKAARPNTPVKPESGTRGGSTAPALHGSLLTLRELLPDGMRVTLSASRASVGRAVNSLLLVELLVAGAALGLAALLVVRATRTALRPLSDVIETAARIARGDTKLRLEPNRTDTELGALAAAFDR